MEEQQLRGRFPSVKNCSFFQRKSPDQKRKLVREASCLQMIRVPVQFSSVQFSSVQFSSVQFKWRPSPSLPDPPARAIGRARATARAAQLAWLDEWCWHGLLTVVLRVERVRPTSDELWRSGVFGLTIAWTLGQTRREREQEAPWLNSTTKHNVYVPTNSPQGIPHSGY